MDLNEIGIVAAVSLPPDTPLILPADVKKYKALRLMNQATKLTLMAIFQAASSAGLDLTTHSDRRAIVVSVNNYDPHHEEFPPHTGHDYSQLRNHVNPLWLLKTLPNMPASHFAILTKSGGPSHTVANYDKAKKLSGDLIISGEANTVMCIDVDTASVQILKISVSSIPSLI